MRIHDTIATAIRGIRVSGSRAILTMLGIIIGIASVTLMSSIGASMQGVILGQISSLGAKSMVIFPGQQEGGPNAFATGHDSLTFDDLEQLKKLTTITKLAPVIFLPGAVSHGREEASPQVFGITEEFFQNQKIEAGVGRLVDRSDIDGARAVAVLAPDAQEKLFGDSDPLGQRMTIGTNTFTVIGVTKALGSQFFQNADDRIYVPFSVAKSATGQKYLNYITMEATGRFDIAFDDVKSLLRTRHSIKNPEDDAKKDDFIVRSSEQANDILSGVSLGLTAFITTIAAISLVVGGIGIMNIMLVSVTERTREIGLRKAVGAKRRDILLQFLFEAIALTVLGGIIGMIIGIGFAFLASLAVRHFLDTYHFTISMPAVIASLIMAGATGLIFGISPARRAASLPPMEALRYE